MKARIIHTNFYSSERVLELSKNARWLFMYYLTCSGIGLTGAFKWSDSKTIFETGLTKSELERARGELMVSKLAHFLENWVVIPNTQEKTGYGTSPVTQKAYVNELSTLPEEIKKMLEGIQRVGIPSAEGVIPIEIRNKKSEIKGKGDARGKTLDEAASQSAAEVLKRHNLNYGTNFTSARSILSNLKYWLEVYKIDQILEADDNIRYDDFWKDKMTPDILLRRKNTKGEDVDYIGKMLNVAKIPDKKPIRLGYKALMEAQQ